MLPVLQKLPHWREMLKTMTPPGDEVPFGWEVLSTAECLDMLAAPAIADQLQAARGGQCPSDTIASSIVPLVDVRTPTLPPCCGSVTCRPCVYSCTPDSCSSVRSPLRACRRHICRQHAFSGTENGDSCERVSELPPPVLVWLSMQRSKYSCQSAACV